MEIAMKAVITALGVVAFAATMAVAKTGKFQTPMEAVSTQQSYVQSYVPWHRSYLDDAWTMAVDQF
jgi:type II secretory pathway component PulK